VFVRVRVGDEVPIGVGYRVSGGVELAPVDVGGAEGLGAAFLEGPVLVLPVAPVGIEAEQAADAGHDGAERAAGEVFPGIGETFVEAVQMMRQIGRTEGSVEFKHMNISAVLDELGLPTIQGYRPMANYQDDILAAIERFLPSRPVLAEAEPALGLNEEAIPFLGPPPDLRDAPPRPPALERLVRKFDAAERDFRNRELGKAGEAAVLRFERLRLEQEERPDLARKVRWVAQEDGDGAGFDIGSFDRSGKERLIEVKTTLGGERTPFYMTRNECALAEERIDAFKLVRVYSFRRQPRMFELEPPLADSVRLTPLTFQASFG
jgi:hypothetical protein